VTLSPQETSSNRDRRQKAHEAQKSETPVCMVFFCVSLRFFAAKVLIGLLRCGFVE
jgi:hypothetical protein